MLRPPRLRVLVAMMLAAVSGCGQDDDERAISLRVAGELGSDVPSTIAWQVELDRAAKLVTVARETLILTNDVEDRVWGLTTWRGGRAFEIDPSLTPWDRGPLVAVAGDRVLLSERRSDEPGDTWMVRSMPRTEGSYGQFSSISVMRVRWWSVTR